MGTRPASKKYKKPKIVLKDCRYVLFVYWLPAYLRVRDGKVQNCSLFGNDPGVKERLSYERLTKLATKPFEPNKLGRNEGGYVGRYALCLLKNGIHRDAEILRVWTKGGLEMKPEEFEEKRANKGKPVGMSRLRMWVMPHEDLLAEMKKYGVVSEKAKGITWYSTDVDVDKNGKYINGFDVAWHSLVNMLKQIRGQFAEARVYDNSTKDGRPVAYINWYGNVELTDFTFRQQILNSQNYLRPQLGLTYHQYL